MIHLSNQRDPFTKPERSLMAWGIGCTARRLAPEWAEPNSPWCGCSRNGAAVTDWDALLADGDHVHYWARPGFIEGATIFNLLVAIAANFAIQKLLLPSKKPVDPGDATSPTYSFAGLRANARGDGLAIPVLYGKHRVTAPIIVEYIRSGFDTSGNPISEYLVLMLISEGPIQSIGNKTADGGPFTREAGNFLQTLQINGQPAENFEGVEAHVRLGSLEQTPIAEVADPVISRDVGLTMEDPLVLTHATTTGDVPSSTTAIATAGASSAGSSNVTKWTDNGETSMVSFVGTDAADEFTAVLEFPQGLILYAADGSTLPNSVLYQLRYVQVDDGGTPFGNYIILPARKIELTRAGLLRIEDKQRTYDPAAYTAPVTGTFVQSRAAAQANPGISVGIDPAKFNAPAPSATRFSFACWIRRRNAQANLTTNRIFQWEDTAANEGFRLSVLRNDASPSTPMNIFASIGTGGGFSDFNLFGAAQAVINDTAVFHHLVFTLEANFDLTGNARLRLYWDGVLKGTLVTSAVAIWDTAQLIRLMSNSETSPTLGYDGHMDEVTVWSKALTPYDVASLYNGGSPIAIDPAAPGLLVGGQWEASDEEGSSPNIGSKSFGPAAFTTLPQRTWRYGTGTNAGTDPNRATGAGIVKITPLANTAKRSKWRVDALRLSTESTSQRNVSEVSFSSIQWRTFQQFEYPGMALCAVKIVATDQLSGSAPIVSVIAEGRKVPVWDGVDLISPNMPDTYSRSPAWISTDMATNPEYGTGAIYTEQKLDIAQFDALADYASTRIYDNGPRQVLISAQQIEAGESGVDINMAFINEDVVRYRLSRLPSNFPSITPGKTLTGKYLTMKITGTPTPSVPAWITTEITNGPQEVLFVAFSVSGGFFQVYCRSSVGFASGSALYTPDVSTVNFIEVERHDARFRFDGYFDRTDTEAWDAITQVLQTARSVPMRIGARLSCFTDQPSSPVALIGQGSIIEDTWQQSFQDVRDRPNAESMEFFDEDKNYERDSATDEHPELVDPSKEGGFRWRRARMEGITRRGQIKRHARRDLNAYFLLRRFVEFELGIDGLAAFPGDVVGISSDTPGYGFSGRIWENATLTTSIKLDRAVTLAPATSYQIQIENVASETRETRAVTQAAGTYAAGTAITVAAFTFTPDKDDEYALGTVVQGEVKLFRIIESSLNPRELRRRVKCIEYNPDVYLDDFGTLPEVQTTTLVAPSAPTVPPGVQNLVASELTVKGPDGSVSIGAQVSFEHFAESYHSVGYTDVYVSVGGHALGFGGAKLVSTLSPADVSIDIRGYHFARYQTYTIWVVPKTRDGATAYRSWASFIEFTPSGLAPTPKPPTNVRAVISGEAVVFQWDAQDDLDHGAIVEARQGGWRFGIPVTIESAQARISAPSLVWSSSPANDFGVTDPPIYFRTKLRTGQYSDVTVLEFTPDVVSADGIAFEKSEENNVWGGA